MSNKIKTRKYYKLQQVKYLMFEEIALSTEQLP